MYVGLKQPGGDGERYVTPARTAAKETKATADRPLRGSVRKCARGKFLLVCGKFG